MNKPFSFNLTFMMTILLLVFTFVGCGNYLAFSTGTKFGLDISQRADQTLDIVMGYQRAEVASIPVPEKTDAGETKDAYAVLGTFNVAYDTKIIGTEKDGLQINQLFATGMAARKAVKNKAMQEWFGTSLGKIVKQEQQQ